MHPEDEWLTSTAAAEILGVNASTLIKYANERQIAHRVLPSGHRRFLRSDLTAFLTKSRVNTTTGDAA